MRPPSWRSAANKAGLASIVFGVLLLLVFKRPVPEVLLWTVLVFSSTRRSATGPTAPCTTAACAPRPKGRAVDWKLDGRPHVHRWTGAGELPICSAATAPIAR